MKVLTRSLILLPVLWVLSCDDPSLRSSSASVIQPASEPCAPVDDIHFICDLISPEDLAVIPETEWVIASGNQEGGKIHLVHAVAKTTSILFPTSSPRVQRDAATYPTCPGPIDPTEGAAFRAHGLYLSRGQNSVHRMYVVHHGNRESVEVFKIDANVTPPVLTWIGCVTAPEGIRLNSVAALPDGGFAVTSFRSADKPASSREDVLAGMISGSVWEWQAESGWSEVPGSDTSGPNGLEISDDGQWLYIAAWGSRSVERLSREQAPPRRDTVDLHFRPDNLRIQPDGSLLAAGANSLRTPDETFHIARIDPETLAFERIIDHTAIENFPACTTAIQIGDEIWMGTNRGEKIGYFPVP